MVPFNKSLTPRLNSNNELPDRNLGVPKIVRMTVTFPATHKTHITHSEETKNTSPTVGTRSASIGNLSDSYASSAESNQRSTDICHAISVH